MISLLFSLSITNNSRRVPVPEHIDDTDSSPFVSSRNRILWSSIRTPPRLVTVHSFIYSIQHRRSLCTILPLLPTVSPLSTVPVVTQPVPSRRFLFCNLNSGCTKLLTFTFLSLRGFPGLRFHLNFTTFRNVSDLRPRPFFSSSFTLPFQPSDSL